MSVIKCDLCDNLSDTDDYPEFMYFDQADFYVCMPCVDGRPESEVFGHVNRTLLFFGRGGIMMNTSTRK